jgi:peroxiredoxin
MVIVFMGEAMAANPEPVPAPSFVFKTLEGEAIGPQSLFGDRPYVLLVFFGVNCLPCKKELAQVSDLWSKKSFRQKARIFAINADGLSPEKLKTEIEKRNIRIDFPVIPDENQVITNLYVSGIVPLTVLIDRQNRIVMSHLGARIESLRKLETRVMEYEEPSAK